MSQRYDEMAGCVVCGKAEGVSEVAVGKLCNACTTKVIDAWQLRLDRDQSETQGLFYQSVATLRELAAEG